MSIFGFLIHSSVSCAEENIQNKILSLGDDGSSTKAGQISGLQRYAYYPLPDLSVQPSMNGIEFSKYSRFWEKWKLVSVRYRSDNGEQRFVYANQIAWDYLKLKQANKGKNQGHEKFPDGAMFGKLAFHTQEDPLFPVSLEPQSFSRLQLMKKDSKNYPDSNGWGYAIILPSSTKSSIHRSDAHSISEKNSQEKAEKKLQGKLQEKLDEKKIAISCHACHLVAANRDFVFSKSPFISSGELLPDSDFRSKFKVSGLEELTQIEKETVSLLFTGNLSGLNSELPSSMHVKYYSMTLFSGSVNESMGVLVKYSIDDQNTYVLSDPKSGHFLMTTPISKVNHIPFQAACSKAILVGMTFSDATSASLYPGFVRIGISCGGKIEWKMIRKI